MTTTFWIRASLGRWLIHTGLWVLPPGRARDLLEKVLWRYGNYVRRTVAKHLEAQDREAAQ